MNWQKLKVRVLNWQNWKLENGNEKQWKLEGLFYIFAKIIIADMRGWLYRPLTCRWGCSPLALSCLPLFSFFFFLALLVTYCYLFILCLAWCLFAQHHYCSYFSGTWHFPINKFPEFRKLPPQKVNRILKKILSLHTYLLLLFFGVFG